MVILLYNLMLIIPLYIPNKVNLNYLINVTLNKKE